MGWWIEENLPALFVGAGFGAVAIELFDPTPYIWIAGALAGIGVALPIWQINKSRWIHGSRKN
jgi:hypothetical protein